MAKGVTETGKKRFGAAVRAAREALELNQVEFAAWLTKQADIRVGASQIGTLERGIWINSVAPDTLIAIVESKILRFPDETPLTLNDCVDIMRERLTLTGERIAPPAVELNR